MKINSKATPYTTDFLRGVIDKNNRYYQGSTGRGHYNLDSAYGLCKEKKSSNDSKKLMQENQKEFYAARDAQYGSERSCMKTRIWTPPSIPKNNHSVEGK